jgi:glutathione synthase/RimK-type ligase-like ATP-grasp enzyme
MPGDYHGAAVQWALRRLGATADLVMMSNVPQRSSLTMKADRGVQYFLDSAGQRLSLSDYDTVWFRRTVKPVPDRSIHPSDWEVARRDWRTMAHSLEYHLEKSGAFCVNSPATATLRDLKPLQLQIAIDCGFCVPETLISNSPEEIRDFIKANRVGGAETIAKPLSAVFWRNTNIDDFGFMTELVTEADPDSCDLVSCPVIPQKRVEKDFEVRVNVLGNTVIAVKIDSQVDESSKVDFRKVDDWRKLSHRLLDIDDGLKAGIVGLARSLGSVFAAMDFIVTRDGEWIFLESNEMGNWLWIESCNPAIPMLDCFAQFLLSRSENFEYDWGRRDRIEAVDFTGRCGSHVRAFVASQHDSEVEPQTAFVYRE